MNTTIGDRLREAREAKGLSQSELARAAEVADYQSIARYERGAATPTLQVGLRLARALGVTLDWLASGEGRGPRSRR